MMLEEINQKNLSNWAWLDISIAFLWRNLCIVGLSSIFGMLIFALVIIMEKIHVPVPLVLLFIGIISLVSGFFLYILQLKWFFRAKYKGFRIAIIKDN